MPSWSVIVAARQPGDHLETVLRALAAQVAPRGGFEVVIVHGEHDEHERAAPRELANVRRVRAAVDADLGLWHQLGWHAATGDVLVFLDATARVGPQWLTALERALTADIDVLVGERRWVDASAATHSESTLGRFPDPRFAALEAEIPALLARRPQTAIVGFAALASNLAIRRTALERTAGFHTTYTRFADIELGIRLWESGSQFGFAPEAPAYHVTETSSSVRWLDAEEAQALYWRHPYRDVLVAQLWALRCQRGDTTSLPELLDARIDPDELRRELGDRTGPGLHTMSEDELIEHFIKMELVPAADMQRYLQHGIAAGLYFEERDGKRWFQVDRIDDWLRDTTPFLVLQYQKDFGRALRQPAPPLDRTYALAVNARYRLAVNTARLAALGVKALNLAVPMTTASQRGVRVVAASAPTLLDPAKSAQGIFVGFPLAELVDGEVWIDVAFETTSPLRGAHDGTDPAKQARAAVPPAFKARTDAVLRSLGLAAGATNAFDGARAIHAWLQDNVLFGVLPPTFQFYRTLDFGAGTCIQQNRLFVTLCRLAKIPAREVCGVLLHEGGEHESSVTKHARTRGYSPFAHTWAEFYSADRGWVPVEIHGFGKRGFTPQTAPSDPERQDIQRVLYEWYPFGTLHPYRIAAGPTVNRIPVFDVPSGADAAAVRDALADIYHEVSCTFTRVE